MPKIRKVHRNKRFRSNVNRKRLRNKLQKLPNIECKVIKDAWEKKCTTIKNLEQMGIAYDTNQAVKIPSLKKEMLKAVEDETDEKSNQENVQTVEPKKLQVVQKLEEDAKWPRARMFRLPNNEVQFATYMMDKYGDDYKAMVRDRKNYNQLTACQMRRKIERFKSIPEQYAEYLVKKGEIVLEDPTPLKKLKPEILKEPVKKNPSGKVSRRKRQKTSLIASTWQEESIENIPIIDYKKTLDDDQNQNEQPVSEKKLQLFPDDEDDKDNDSDLSDEKEVFNVSDGESEDDAMNQRKEKRHSNKKVNENKKNSLKLNKKVSKKRTVKK